MKTTIYHNPRWGKSRDSVRILEEKNIDYKIVEYLKTPLTKEELKNIINVLNIKTHEIVRISEKDFIDNNLSSVLDDIDKTIDAIIEFPKILQRPIIINEKKGVIGRPPEKILDLL